MPSSGPIIEELPDDYEEEKPAVSSSEPASSSSAVKQSSSSEVRSSAAESSSAGLRKGFFNRSAPAASATTSSPAKITEEVGSSSPSTAAATREDAATKFTSSGVRSSESGDEGEILRLLGSLKEQLAKAESLNEGRETVDEGISSALQELRVALEGSAAPSARWPTSQVRSGFAKSSQEANSALAEMRNACNEARRSRSGEEKKATVELRRVADEVSDRLRKVVDLSAPAPIADEDKSTEVVKAFHALPFTTKLRLFADDRIALSLIGTSVAAGMLLVFGILAEVYSAWGCGYQCGATA